MMDVIVIACQEFGLTVSEKKTEVMHLWSHISTAANALRVEAAGKLYKQTTEFAHLGGVISERVDLDTEIKRRIGAAWASVRRYSYHILLQYRAKPPLREGCRCGLSFVLARTCTLLCQPISCGRGHRRRVLQK